MAKARRERYVEPQEHVSSAFMTAMIKRRAMAAQCRARMGGVRLNDGTLPDGSQLFYDSASHPGDRVHIGCGVQQLAK
jgi:hypothetical protein